MGPKGAGLRKDRALWLICESLQTMWRRTQKTCSCGSADGNGTAMVPVQSALLSVESEPNGQSLLQP